MRHSSGFVNPPIVEMVLGVQFSSLTKLTSGHYGLFWKELGDGWIKPEDEPLIEDNFELFDRPARTVPAGLQLLRLEPVRLPGRFMLWHESRDRLLQIQATRFHLNWRKHEGNYPSYNLLIGEFEKMFARFSAFALREDIGVVSENQWEITYVNSFSKGEYWDSPTDWSIFLPGLFGQLFQVDDLNIALEHRAAEWSYEISPKRGRLHVAARPGRAKGDDRDALLLQMTARGPVGRGGVSKFRDGLDLGHDAAYGAFLRMVSEETKQRWEKQP